MFMFMYVASQVICLSVKHCHVTSNSTTKTIGRNDTIRIVEQAEACTADLR